MPTLGVVIRFKDSAGTLPAVLAALATQSRPPDLIVGVDTGSRDGSSGLMRAAGAQVVAWTDHYSHPRSLNHGIAACATDLVLALSSHTVPDGATVLADMVAALADPAVVAVSHRPPACAVYPERIAWTDVVRLGLTWDSFYSNSSGMFRRADWQVTSFAPDTPIAEDYDWVLGRLRAGGVALSWDFPRRYLRGTPRDDRAYEMAKALTGIARRHGLRLRRGWGEEVGASLRAAWWLAKTLGRDEEAQAVARSQRQRLWGRLRG